MGAHSRRKGYVREQFNNAFRRYLPPNRSATPRQCSNDAASGQKRSATTSGFVADRKSPEASNGAGCRGVADRKGGTREEGHAERVACADCRHFSPNITDPKNGIGTCAVNAWRQGKPALWPWAPRHCPAFEPVEP